MSFGLKVSLGRLAKQQIFIEEMVKEEQRLNDIINELLNHYVRHEINGFMVSKYSGMLISTFADKVSTGARGMSLPIEE